VADARQARENQAYVRRLLQERQPEFAAALEAAVLEWAARDLSCQPGREPPPRCRHGRRPPRWQPTAAAASPVSRPTRRRAVWHRGRQEARRWNHR
jgi:hypothetical protein